VSPGAGAVAGNNVNLSFTNPTKLSIDPQPATVSPAAAGTSVRDPVVVGVDEFGGSAVAAGTTFPVTLSFAGLAEFPRGSTFTSTEVIAPTAITDPDVIFVSPPAGTDLFYSLSIDNTGPGGPTVQFTPGVSDADFNFSFTSSPAAIQSAVLAYLAGGGGDNLVVGTATALRPFDNVTLADEDDAGLTEPAVPEPASWVLLSIGLVGLGYLGRRVRTRPEHGRMEA
jgi:hypothetical protein